ncbi:TniB family NTP-binding protein [Rhodobacter sp. CZR27]|uniref:TniB family NTP-binding protein n=1 Tax=Rhodobacter sp. CZR27 TaxID=2033869 RepID=UPI000BBE7D17|nr:TniB family NTP-binding protein [Rhodobacter sp. CZR27]
MTASSTTTPAYMANAPDPSDPAKFCNWLRDRYMPNARDDVFVAGLKEILETTPAGDLTAAPMRFGLVDETRGLLVFAESGSGKTSLIKRNLMRASAIGLSDGPGPGKALYVRVPPEATLKGVARVIGEKTGYPISPKLRTPEAWEIATHRLGKLGITILCLDETHHLLKAKNELEDVLQRLKSLMQGENALALVVSGVPSLDAAIRQDRETSRRFAVRIALQPIRTHEERGRLKDFIARCCALAKLALPDDPHLVERLAAATHGSFGRSIDLMHGAIYRALRRGNGRLTLDDFRQSFDLERGAPGVGPFGPEDWPSLEAHLKETGWAP